MLTASPPPLREKKRRPAHERVTVWGYPPRRLADILEFEGGRGGFLRIFLCGGRPGGGRPDAMYRWFQDVPGGWGVEWRPHADRPVLKVTRKGAEGAQTIEVRRAVDWFPEDARADSCRAAWETLGAMLAGAFWGAVPFSTPALTGLDTWDRSVRHDYAPLDGAIRDQIHATTGQGRIELFRGAPDTIPALFHYDSRFAYAAIGGDTLPVTFVGHDDGADFLGYTPARYRVEFRAPAGWAHLGLLPQWNGTTWEYPLEGEGWADGCEVMLALKKGWGVRICERIIFDNAGQRPLDTWRAQIIALRERTENPLVQGALRAILLHGIGAFARRTRPVQVRIPAEDGPADHGIDPADIIGERTRVGDTERTLTVRSPLAKWSARQVHPEWAAHVWARQRARMATAALQLPPAQLLAIETDGIYTTAKAPWRDDGKVGRLRLKDHLDGPLLTPRTWAELHQLRDGGTNNGL